MATEDLGSIASRICKMGDPAIAENRARQSQMLDQAEALSKLTVLQGLDETLARLRYSTNLIQRNAELLQEQQVALTIHMKESEHAVAWEGAGLRQKVPTWRMPTSIRYLINFAIAAIDFNIFAIAFTYGTGESSSLTSVSYWMGGALGLMVFVVGLLVARLLKEGAVHRAQRRLLKEVPKESASTATQGTNSGLVVGGGSGVILWTILTIYVALTGGGFVVRLGALEDWRDVAGWAVLVLQTLIPLVTVALEILIHDPLEVPKAPGLRMGILRRWRLRYLSRRERTVVVRRDKAEEVVARRYAFEREALAAMQASDSRVGLGS